ncbi:MAG TPA: MFS transporter [Stellaceae bacterium]|nr:MFS transporter [Stellaceae bacterium]
MLDVLERQQKLTLNQWKIVSAAILGDMLDFFDFFLIGYVLAFIVKAWHLSYLESGVILLAAGVGAIPGAFFWGWMADRIGRRKVFIATALNFSLATGAMAFTPDQYGWLILAFFRLLVGVGVAGLVAVDLPLVQEFVPSSKRGWIGGLVTSTVSIGGALGAACGAYLGPVIGWRGLFLVGLLPAFFTLMIRAWVPESPRWLIRRGRLAEARKSIAWALQKDPSEIEVSEHLPEIEHTPWRELFKYPRSVALVCLTGLSQTSGVGLALWAPTLLLLLLHTTAAEASFLMIWVGLSAFVGRIVCAFLADFLGRRGSGIFACLGGVVTLIVAGHLSNLMIGSVSVFWLMLMAHSFFGGGSYTIIAPYMAEVWPAGLRASGMGLGYGVGNFGKIISPLGLALIVGGTDFVKPAASVGAIVPAMYFLAFWAALAAVAFLMLGIETKGRSIEEIDESLARSASVKARA